MQNENSISNESSFGKCICDRTGQVIEQNNFIQKLCGNKIGEICLNGCRQFLRPEDKYEVSLLKYRTLHGKCFHITGHKNKNEEMIILQPVASNNYFNLDSLSPKEREIAELMLNGLMNSEIVKKLQITKATLKTHINHIYQKIGSEFKIQRLELLS